MFGIDGPEFLVIIVILIVVVGPRDLPKMMRAFGKATARMRATAQEFRQHFDEAMREADMEDLRDSMQEMKKLDPRDRLTKVFDPIRTATQGLQEEMQKVSRSKAEKLQKSRLESTPPTALPTEADVPAAPVTAPVQNSIKSLPAGVVKKKATAGKKPKTADTAGLAGKTGKAGTTGKTGKGVRSVHAGKTGKAAGAGKKGTRA